MQNEMHEIVVSSSLDGSVEPSLFWMPESMSAPVPLVVGLHTWSFDRFNQVEAMLPRCRERGWALLLPEFRGPNSPENPRATEAGGSRLAVQDVVDAADWVLARNEIDAAAQFVLGGSGGGHMALLQAANEPTRWAGVGSWVPITDLAAWHEQNEHYRDRIEAVCGGAPDEMPEEYAARSPLTYAESIAQARLSLHHGRGDEAVPYCQSWMLAQELERLGASKFYFDLFDGGHECRYDISFAWFDRQLAGKGGPGLTG